MKKFPSALAACLALATAAVPFPAQAQLQDGETFIFRYRPTVDGPVGGPWVPDPEQEEDDASRYDVTASFLGMVGQDPE